jgi:hypothetical protein
MRLNREAKTTGSICIALLRRSSFQVEVVNEVHFPCSMEIIKALPQGNFRLLRRLVGIGRDAGRMAE